MITDRPAVDWLTVTSFHSIDAIKFRAAIANVVGKDKASRKGKVMQYAGLTWGNAFLGEGVQSRRTHYMLRASGELADRVHEELSDDIPGVCTRIDLQMTIALPRDYSARKVRDSLVAADWLGRRRKVTFIEGDDGLDTVYVGSRSSDRYIRLYVKFAEDRAWLRFEVEYKGDTADRVRNRVAVGGWIAMGQVLYGEVVDLPQVDITGLSQVRDSLKGYGLRGVDPGRRVKDRNSTLAWLERQVSPAVVRGLRDHDDGEEYARIIQEWYELAEELGRC